MQTYPRNFTTDSLGRTVFLSPHRHAIDKPSSRLTFMHPVIWIGLLATISMFGALQRPPIAPVNFTYLTFGVVLFFFIIYWLRNKASLQMVWTRPDTLVAVILFMSFFSTLLANFLYDLPLDFLEGSSTTFIGMLVLYFLTRLSLRRREHVYFLLSLLLLGFLIYNLLGVGLFVLHPEQANTTVFGEELKVADTGSFGEGMRLNGLVGNANMFVSIPLLALPLAMAMFTCSASLWRKAWYMVIMVASAIAIFLSFSRSSWFAMAVALLALGRLMFLGRGKGALKIFATLLLLGLLSLPLVSSLGGSQNQFFARLDSVSEEDSLGSRPDMWLHALNIVQQFPTGVGLGNYQEASLLTYSKYSWLMGRSPHNTLVALSVEGSLIVGLAMAWLMWRQIGGVIPQRKQRTRLLKLPKPLERVNDDPRYEALLIGLSAAFLALWLHSAVHSVHAQISIWVLAACQTSLRQLKF